MINNSKLHRAAYHEAAHATLAVLAHLPLRSVEIFGGSGATKYSRSFSSGEVEIWTVVTLAAIEAEVMLFGSAPVDGDLDTIRQMTQRLGVRFFDLDQHRSRAHDLVHRHRAEIDAVATELLRRRTMSGDEVAAMLGTTVTPSVWDWAR